MVERQRGRATRLPLILSLVALGLVTLAVSLVVILGGGTPEAQGAGFLLFVFIVVTVIAYSEIRGHLRAKGEKR